MQYVVEALQKLSRRFNWRKTGFKHPNKHEFFKTLSRYFHEGK